MVTREEIESAKTPKGGFTKETLAQWGVTWPPQNGWIDQLVTESCAIEEFNRIRDRLRAAPDAEAVNRVADEEREAVTALKDNPKTNDLFCVIRNLKVYLLQVKHPAQKKRPSN